MGIIRPFIECPSFPISRLEGAFLSHVIQNLAIAAGTVCMQNFDHISDFL
jgi:hypothetical protein